MVTAKDMVDYFSPLKSLKSNSALDVHKKFFLYRRAASLISQYSAWILEGDHTTLKNRIDSDFQAVETFGTQKIGTHAAPGTLLAAGGGAGTPSHLDLSDLALQRTTDRATFKTVKVRLAKMTALRYQRAQWILWRAAGIQKDIWDPSPDGKTATLKEAILSEYLDRRLRIVERMHFNIAVAKPGEGGMGWGTWPVISSAKGPWKDGFRVRVVEYPRIAIGTKNPADSAFVKIMGGVANIAPENSDTLPNDPHDKPGATDSHAGNVQQHWNWGHNKRRLEWRVGPPDMDVSSTRKDIWGAWDKFAWRFPPSIRTNWKPSTVCQFHIYLQSLSGATGAQAVDSLFDYIGHSREDWWERSWLWCDQTISACHLDALLFGLRRRYGSTTADTEFNDLVGGINLPAGGVDPYVQLRPLIRGNTDPAAGDAHKLMTHCVDENNCPDRYFQNLWIQDADLQVGDHVIFWNHVLYSILSSGDWRLENALVMQVNSTADGSIDPASIALQGHGTIIEPYPNYQGSIAHHLQSGLAEARRTIKVKLETAPKPPLASVPVIAYRGYQLVQWSPFGNVWNVTYSGKDRYQHNAWWVEIPLDITLWSTLADAVKGLPNVIAYTDTSGFSQAPPKPLNRQTLTQPDAAPYNYSNVVYFPLFAPAVSPVTLPTGEKLEGWAAYIERRKMPNPPNLTLLKPVYADGKFVRGIYWRPDRSVPIVRPRAKV